MGFPPGQDQPPVVVLSPASKEGTSPPPVDVTPWQYQQQWDPVREREEQREKWAANLKRRTKQFGAFCSLTLFFYLAIALFAMILVTPETMQRLNAADPSSGLGVLFVITPSIVPVLNISGLALVGFFILLVLAIIVSYLYAMGESLFASINELILGRAKRHSTILTIGGLFFAMLAINIIYYSLIRTSGISPTVPDYQSEPLWESVFGFAKASVWEEIIVRVLFIGVPLLWIDLIFRRSQLLPPVRYFTGGGMKFGSVECTLIAFSAIMFGFGHVQSWDFWKVIPSALTGLCFGYLYVRIGLYAAILFHFAFNFLNIPVRYFGDAGTVTLGLLSWLWLAAGLIFIIYYTMQLARFLRDNVFSYEGASSQTPRP